MATEQALNIAIVGAGGISRSHLPAFLKHPDKIRLAAICDARDGAAEALAEEILYPVATFASVEETIAAGNAQAAILTLPHYLHHPLATQFVDAGIPVLVEKPLACNVTQMRDLLDRSQTAGVPVVAGQMQRFSREAVFLKRWIEGDDAPFGSLRGFDMQIWQNINGWLAGKSNPWLLDGKLAGGGVIISVAVHKIDLIRYLTGLDFVEVTARGRFDKPFINGAESSASVLASMSNGASGTIHASYTAVRVPFNESMTLHGSNGVITTLPPRRSDTGYAGYWYAGGPTSITEWDQMFQGFQPAPAGENWKAQFEEQLLAFAASLRDRTLPQNDISENFNTIATIDAIAKSIRSGNSELVETS